MGWTMTNWPEGKSDVSLCFMCKKISFTRVPEVSSILER
jgi:hypothetical protein